MYIMYNNTIILYILYIKINYSIIIIIKITIAYSRNCIVGNLLMTYSVQFSSLISAMKLCLIPLGVLLRILTLHVETSSIQEGLLVGPGLADRAILECSFLDYRGHLDLAPSVWCSSYMSRSFFWALEMFTRSSQLHILNITGLLAQLIVVFSLEHIERIVSGSTFGLAATVYWLNPVTILSCHVSPIPHMLHMLICIILISATKFDWGVSCASFLILTACSLQFIVLLPSFFLLNLPDVPVYKYRFLETVFWYTLVVSSVIIVLYFLFTFVRQYVDIALLSVRELFRREIFSVDSYSFSPSLSLLWYLNVQV